MDFCKNKLINETIDEYVCTFSHTLDTGEFIDEKFLRKIDKYIFKNLKIKFKEIEIFNLLFLQEKGYKLGVFQKLKIWLSGLKPIYLHEKKEQALAEEKKKAKAEERKKIKSKKS